MKILITGTKGFIGKNLLSKLKDGNEYKWYDILKKIVWYIKINGMVY